MKTVLYTTGCPRCKILESALDKANIKYSVVNDIDEMLNKGFMEAPMLEAEGKAMGFMSAMKWVSSHESAN